MTANSGAPAPDRSRGRQADERRVEEDRPRGPRGESPGERLNRNWSDILQELKVVQSGSQIITGFLLAAAFQQRFAELDTTGLVLYLALVVAAVVTTVLGMTPVILHRRLFREGRKAELVDLGNRLAAATLVGVASSASCSSSSSSSEGSWWASRPVRSRGSASWRSGRSWCAARADGGACRPPRGKHPAPRMSSLSRTIAAAWRLVLIPMRNEVAT